MTDEAEQRRVLKQTHVFQNIRPFHPVANALCARCSLALPHGPMLMFNMVPCPGPVGMNDEMDPSKW